MNPHYYSGLVMYYIIPFKKRQINENACNKLYPRDIPRIRVYCSGGASRTSPKILPLNGTLSKEGIIVYDWDSVVSFLLFE